LAAPTKKSKAEALSILANKPAGKRNKAGKFPKNSLNFLIENKLSHAAKKKKKKASK
jgi:hypothetical protein